MSLPNLIQETSFRDVVNALRSRMNMWSLMELILPIYITFVLMYTFVTGSDFFGIGFHSWLLLMMALLPAIIIFLILVGKLIGFSDYRFKVLLHVLVIGIIAEIDGILLHGSGFFDILTVSQASKEQILFSYLIQVMTGVLIAVGAVMNIYNLSSPFLEKYKDVKQKIENNDLSVRITDPKLLNDSAFGPISKLVNQILETASSAVNSLRHTSVLLQSISKEIVSLTEETNAATEVVASSTATLTKGSNDQADAIMKISEVMESLQHLLDEVITEIGKNAKKTAEIAQMTTILSLNASIEASRAGEQVRGFTVIAENIRRLANDSKKSAEEINKVVNLITDTYGKKFTDVKLLVEEVSSIAEENAASTEEISASIEELAANTEHLASVAQDLANQATETLTVIEKYRL